MKHPASRALFSYWDTLRGERTAPERSELDPGAIRNILADTFILEVDTDRTFPFRLAGTRVCALYGRDLKAVSFLELWPPRDLRAARDLVLSVLSEMAGAVAGISARTAGGSTHELELLLLPLRHGGKTHSRLVGCITAEQAPPWIGLDPVLTQSITGMRMLVPAVPRPDGPGFGLVRKLAERLKPAERRGHLSVYPGGRDGQKQDGDKPGSVKPAFTD
jgi:hypothetical protein